MRFHKHRVSFRSKAFSVFLFLSLAFVSSATLAEPFEEYYMLNRYKEFVQKTNFGFLVKTKSGKKIRLDNCIDETCLDAWESYSFKDVVDHRYLIFLVGGYEWASFDVIDLVNNQILKINSFPYFSPDLTRIASINADEMNGSSIDIYELRENKFKNVFSSQDKEFSYPKFHSWNGENQVRIIDGESQNNLVNMVLSFDKDSNKWSYKKANKPFPQVKTAPDEIDFVNRFPDIMGSFSDKKLVLSLLQQEHATVKYLDSRLYDDEEVMNMAMKSHFSNAQYLSPRLKNDADFMKAAIERNKSIFQFSSEKLRDDKDLVIKVFGLSNGTSGHNLDLWGKVLSAASNRLRDDEELLKIAIASHDEEFHYASKRLKDKAEANLEFAKSLVAINCRVFVHFSEKLRDNKDLLLAAENEGKCRASSYVFKAASSRLRDNVYVVRDIAKMSKKFSPFVLEVASDSIKNNKKFMIEFAKQGICLGFNKSRFKDDQDTMQKLEYLNSVNCQ
ncbi:MAG: DUF4116 domain-containing protein [Rickettsiales bacterium]|nr:DUF4116 domain-containing protein [Rickettsiales bacterium]